MAPPNIKDSLPVIQKIGKWFTKQGYTIDSPIFRLHHQATSFVLILGFAFVTFENFLDTKAIVCHGKEATTPFSKQYCWMHGYSYLMPQIREEASGCYVDQTHIASAETAPITTYYLWLPYLMSLLFFLCKLPHTVWKKYFENNLINQILAGRDDNWDGVGGGGKGGQGGGGDGQQGGKKKGGNQGQGGGQGPRHSNKPLEIATKFIEYRKCYAFYQIKFAFWEFANFFIILFSMFITHWLLNDQFLTYGTDVIRYLQVYQAYHAKEVPLHDPMCQVFPTEVMCRIQFGAAPGGADAQNFLCILGNNLFNQKYFFFLWLWWTIMLVLSVLGFLYRVTRILVPFLSKALMRRKVFGIQLDPIWMSSGECFVLELVLDNLVNKPKLKDLIIEEIANHLKTLEFRMSKYYREDSSLGYNLGDKQPLLLTEEAEEKPALKKPILTEEVKPVQEKKPNSSGKAKNCALNANSTMKAKDANESKSENPPNYSFVENQVDQKDVASFPNPNNYLDLIWGLDGIPPRTYDAILKSQEEMLKECNKNVSFKAKPTQSKKKKDKNVVKVNVESPPAASSTPVKNEAENIAAGVVIASCPNEIDETVSSISPDKHEDLLWI